MSTQSNSQEVAQFKQAQRESWRNFAPLEVLTMQSAAHLVRFAGVSHGLKVLDAGCGTGVVAITAARCGAEVDAVDLTPQLLEHARRNCEIAGLQVSLREGDVEELPFADSQFDVVLSQFAHIFAPRPEIAIAEMLRVLKPGGSIAFATWPPEMLVGSTTALGARYMPAPAAPAPADPMLWGDPAIIRERLGNGVSDLFFDRGCILVPALSPQHFRLKVEGSAGPIIKLIENLSTKAPERLQQFRQEFDSIVARFFRDNKVRQDYLLSRATKSAV
jgi:SAM-dependent methyltransferase